jgi:hypothetical protein
VLGGRCALSGCALSGCARGLLLLLGGPLDLSKHQLIRDGGMARHCAALRGVAQEGNQRYGPVRRVQCPMPGSR